jgi:FkbM family methyltransferase
MPTYGLYLDVGCGWPDRNSNTAFLRARGWSGLAIDANPDYLPDWQAYDGGRYAGHFMVAIVSDESSVPFQMIPHNALESRVNPDAGVESSAVRLDALLKVCGWGRRDLLSVDVEGHEMAVLRTLPVHLIPPIVVVEWNTTGREPDLEPLLFLTRSGWRLVHATKSNFVLFKR